MHKTKSIIVTLIHLFLLLAVKALANEQPDESITSKDNAAQQANANATNIAPLAKNSKPDRCTPVHEFLIKPHFACLSLSQNAQLQNDVKYAEHKCPTQAQATSHVMQFMQPPAVICHPYHPLYYDPVLQHILRSLHLQEQTALNNIVHNNIFVPETEFETVPLVSTCSCRKCQHCTKPKNNIAAHGEQQQDRGHKQKLNC